MTQFTKSFLWRFIVDIIILGFFVRLLQGIILGVLSNFMESTSTPFLIFEAVIVAAVSMLFICLITYWNIGVISNKGCYDYPQNPDKWFRNFALILIGLDLVSTIIKFMRWKSQLSEQYAKLDRYEDAFAGYGVSSTIDQTRETLSSLNKTLIICLIIQNIIGIAILFLMLPRLKKKYNEN